METLKLIIQFIFILSLVIAFAFLARLNNSLKLERRFNKYTVDSLKDKNKPFFTIIYNIYLNIRDNLTNYLAKIKIFNRYSKSYEKYLDKSKRQKDDPLSYIATKIIFGIVAFAIVLFSFVLQNRSFDIIGFIILGMSLVVGFFIPDIMLFSQKAIVKRQLENNLLQAIIIMNNAFKSGQSIIQAVSLVSEELTGPISDEFKKMYIDLSFGLSIENVFARFSNRGNIEEAKMMTASLVILNKTGGNIVKVFSSIERNFFNRRKLQEELQSLTASSRAIFIILVMIPVLLVSFIYIFNQNYFSP